MLLYFIGMVLVAQAIGAPQYGGEHEYSQQHEVHDIHVTPVPILQYKSERHKEGYQFSYKTANGIHAEEAGYVKKTGEKEDDNLIVMHGSVSYTSPDGTPIKLTYIADEHGFQPQGAHLPTPPPIPPEIQKALQQADHHEPIQQQHHQHHQEVAYDEHQQQYSAQYE